MPGFVQSGRVCVILRRLSQLVLLLLALKGVCPLHCQVTHPFEDDIRAFEASDQRNPPPAPAILFLGSSSVVRWSTLENDFPDYPVINRGFGGSQAEDTLHFFDRIVIPYRPPLIVYYEGDNDLAAGKSVDTVFTDWSEFVRRVQDRLPNTHVLFISVKPSPSRAGIQFAMRALNERIRAMCDADPKLWYADVFTPMLNPAGQPRPDLFASDNLHLNQAGYVVWRSVVGPVVDAWAASYPVRIQKPQTGTLLIDFGSASAPSDAGSNPVSIDWNNLSYSIGGSSSGVLSNLVNTGGTRTDITLRMLSRFNGVNENGTTASTVHPASATRDSLFGNTESFGGLANVTPRFELLGLPPATRFKLEFYASRMSVSDNRETRYTVTGEGSVAVDLNAANNIDRTAILESFLPSAAGSLQITLSPGPNNNNSSHFTYLGVLRLEPVDPPGPALLIDFGSPSNATGRQTAVAAGSRWNDVDRSLGGSDTGVLAPLVATNGRPTAFALRMLSRFNGANEDGTTNSVIFPATATRDSLFGNSEPFGGLAEITPAFLLSGIDPEATCQIIFHASRMGVTDNRQTLYTVAGSHSETVSLNPSNNENELARTGPLRPAPDGTLRISLSPGPENNNPFHFVYLGVLQMDWTIDGSIQKPALVHSRIQDTQFRFELLGAPGLIYQVQETADLRTWTDLLRVSMGQPVEPVAVDAAGETRWFRVLQ